MNATTVAVDLAKSVFQLTVADSRWKHMKPAALPAASSSAGSRVVMCPSSSPLDWHGRNRRRWTGSDMQDDSGENL